MRKRLLGAMTVAVAVVIFAGLETATTAAPASGPSATASAFKGHDGRIVYQSSPKSNWDLYSIAPEDDLPIPRRLTTHRMNDVQPAVSPNGKRIAFVRDFDTDDSEILVMDADGSDQRTLLRNKAQDREPVFSPDGNRIAFISGPSRRPQIWVIDANGGQPTQLTTEIGGAKRALTFSPDGSQLLFSGVSYETTPLGHDAIIRISAWQPGQREQTAVGVIAPNEQIYGFSLSANGTRRVVAFRSKSAEAIFTRWEPYHIYLGPAGGACGACAKGDWGKFPGRQLTAAGDRDDHSPVLSPEGNRVVFVRGPGNDLYVVLTVTNDGTFDPARRLTFGPGSDANPDWGPAP